MIMEIDVIIQVTIILKIPGSKNLSYTNKGIIIETAETRRHLPCTEIKYLITENSINFLRTNTLTNSDAIIDILAAQKTLSGEPPFRKNI